MTNPTKAFLYTVLLIAAVVGSRAPWLEHDIWSLDEGSTFTMAQQVLEGDVLYRDAADNRSPLVPYLKALVFAVFGDWNAFAVHTVLAVSLGLVAALIGWIGFKLDGARTGGIAAITFVILQIAFVTADETMSANTEWFVVIFSTAAFALFANAFEAPNFKRGLLPGFLFGLAVLCKQPGLLDFIVASVILALVSIPPHADRSRYLRLWFGLTIGLLVPLAVALVYFVWHDAYDDYIYYAFTFNTKLYLPEYPLGERLLAVRLPFQLAWHHVPVIGLIGVGAAVGLLIQVTSSALRTKSSFPIFPWLVLGWTAAGLISTTLSGREFSHYSVQVIPGLSLAVGWGVHRLLHWRPQKFAFAGPMIAGTLCLAILIQFANRYQIIDRELSGAKQYQLDYGTIVQRYTTPTERIFVWGYYPEIYFHAQRLPATRFVYTNYITGMIAWSNIDAMKKVEYAVSPGGWDKFYADFAKTPPALIVDTKSGRNYVKFPIANRPPLWREINAHYAQIALEQELKFGMRFFRRLTDPTERSVGPFNLSPTVLQVKGWAPFIENEPPRLQVNGPAGFDHVELVVNGEIKSSLGYSDTDPLAIRFFIPGNPFTASSVKVRAYGPAGSVESDAFDFESFARFNAATKPQVPTLQIDQTLIKPCKVFTALPYVSPHALIEGTFDLHVPARLEFECPAGVDRLTFYHGLAQSVIHLSDGYDIELNWITDAGKTQQLWYKRVMPRKGGEFQIPQEESVNLPSRSPGRLEVKFYAGEFSDTSNDHLFFGRLVGETHTPNFRLGETLQSATAATDESHQPLKTNVQGDWMVHPAARITWTRPANLMSFEFEYGIDEGAYDPAAAGHSNGVQFTLELIDAEGQTTVLWEQLLEPFNHPAHRGRQTARITLPRDLAGDLVLRTGPGYLDDASWDWAWVGNFRAESPGPPLVLSPTRKIASIATAGYEGGWADQFDATHWGAQPPQTITYPKPVDLAEVTFTFGLNDNAAADENGVRRSDGVTAILLFSPVEGPDRELYRRTLNPFANPADFGPKTATVPVPLGEAGELILQMDPGPHGDNSYDWAYWGPLTGRLVDAPE